jgi:hypothetical protein
MFSFIDINECALASDQENICPDDTTDCFNTFGGYICECAPGYEKADTTVIVIFN